MFCEQTSKPYFAERTQHISTDRSIDVPICLAMCPYCQALTMPPPELQSVSASSSWAATAVACSSKAESEGLAVGRVDGA